MVSNRFQPLSTVSEDQRMSALGSSLEGQEKKNTFLLQNQE